MAKTSTCAEFDFAGICNAINDYLKVNENNKRKYGEVFTPIAIIDEMLNELDAHYMRENSGKSIFTNPYNKWFDPAAGVGNFLLIIYLRLFDGLKSAIKSDSARHKHIVSKMLYYAELNKTNCARFVRLINSLGAFKIKPNIYCGDSLKADFKTKFDIIVGNPPYNRGAWMLNYNNCKFMKTCNHLILHSKIFMILERCQATAFIDFR